MKIPNKHSSAEHPILKLKCNTPTCEYGTSNATSLALHTKKLHEKDLCKKFKTITVGSAHKEYHEKTVLGVDITHPTIRQGTQPTIKGKKHTAQKHFIKRKLKKLQHDVTKLKI